MMSSLVNAALFLALVATSVCVVSMYRKLKRLDSYHAEYKRIFDQTAEALTSANEAVQMLNEDGKDVLLELGQRIEEARGMILKLDRANNMVRVSAPHPHPAPSDAD